MAKKLKDYEKRVKTALSAAGRYTVSLDIQIYALAGALLSLDIVNDTIEGLESCVVDDAHGLKAHPAFRIRKEAEDSVTRQMKALGLTAEDLSGSIETDELLELTKKVAEAGRGKRRITPVARKKRKETKQDDGGGEVEADRAQV